MRSKVAGVKVADKGSQANANVSIKAREKKMTKIWKPTKPPTGKGLGKAGAKRLGRLLKRAVQVVGEPAAKTNPNLPKTPVRLFKHQIQTKTNTAQTKSTSHHISELILSVVAQCKHRGGISMAELKQTLAARGYDVTKNNRRVTVVTQRLVNSETLVQTTRNATFRLRNKKNQKQTDTTHVKMSMLKSPKPNGDLKLRKAASKSLRIPEKTQDMKTVKPRGKLYNSKGRSHREAAEKRKRGKYQKPAARSQKLTDKTHKPAARSQKLTDKTHKPAARSQKPTDKTRKPASRSQKPTNKTRKPASRSQKLTDKTRKPASRSQKLTDKTRKPASRSQKLTDKTRKPASRSQKLTDKTRKPASRSQKLTDKTRKPAARSQKLTDKTRKPASRSQKSTDKSHKPASRSQKPTDKTRKPASRSQKLTDKTRKPASRSQKLTDNTRKPPARSQKLTDKTRKPPARLQKLTDKTRKPASRSQKLTDKTRKPASRSHKIMTKTHKPAGNSNNEKWKTAKGRRKQPKPALRKHRSGTKRSTQVRKKAKNTQQTCHHQPTQKQHRY